MARFLSKFGLKGSEGSNPGGTSTPTSTAAAATEGELPPMRMEPGTTPSNNNHRNSGPTSYRGRSFGFRGGGSVHSMSTFDNETEDYEEDDGTATSGAGWSVDALTVGTRSNLVRAGESAYDFDSFKTGGLSKWSLDMASSIFVGTAEQEGGVEEEGEEDEEGVSKIAKTKNEKRIEAMAGKGGKRRTFFYNDSSPFGIDNFIKSITRPPVPPPSTNGDHRHDQTPRPRMPSSHGSEKVTPIFSDADFDADFYPQKDATDTDKSSASSASFFWGGPLAPSSSSFFMDEKQTSKEATDRQKLFRLVIVMVTAALAMAFIALLVAKPWNGDPASYEQQQPNNNSNNNLPSTIAVDLSPFTIQAETQSPPSDGSSSESRILSDVTSIFLGELLQGTFPSSFDGLALTIGKHSRRQLRTQQQQKQRRQEPHVITARFGGQVHFSSINAPPADDVQNVIMDAFSGHSLKKLSKQLIRDGLQDLQFLVVYDLDGLEIGSLHIDDKNNKNHSNNGNNP